MASVNWNSTDGKTARRLPGDPRVQVLLLLGLALIARLAFLLLTGWFGRVINNDAYDYLAIASNLVQGRGFALADGAPTAFRPFGYPLFLAAVQLLAGPSVAVVQLLQVALGAAVVAPTYALARLVWNDRVAVLSAAGVALHPVLIYLAVTLSPDLLALLAVMVALWATARIVQSGSGRMPSIAIGALAGAVAVLMRPEMLLVLWLLPLFLMLQFGARSVPVRQIALLAILATCLALIPPAIRNWQRFGQFIPLPTIGGVTFWGSNNARANGGWLLPSADNWPDDDPPASMRGWIGLSETRSQRRFYETSWRWLTANPLDGLKLVPQKLYRSWTISYADEQRAAAGSAILFPANLAFGLLVIAGAALLAQGHRSALWLFSAPILAWLLKTVLFYGSARQTSAVLPMLIILAAGALDGMWLRLRRPVDSQIIPKAEADE